MLESVVIVIMNVLVWVRELLVWTEKTWQLRTAIKLIFPAYMSKASQFYIDFPIAIISCCLDSVKRSVYRIWISVVVRKLFKLSIYKHYILFLVSAASILRNKFYKLFNSLKRIIAIVNILSNATSHLNAPKRRTNNTSTEVWATRPTPQSIFS